MSEQSSSSLFERNLDALRGIGYGDIAARASNIPAMHPDETLLHEDGSPLYKPDTDTFITQQLDAYRSNPNRYFLNITGVPESSPQISHKAMREMMVQLQGKYLNATPDLNSGFFVSFGLGLGLHLSAIIDDYDFEELIVIEPNPNYLRQSLTTLDWTDLLSRLDARNRRITIIHAEDPAETARALMPPLRSHHFPQLDGLFVYPHYHDSVMEKIVAEVRALMPVIEGTDGFFEDEQRMLDQAVANCMTHDHHVLYDQVGRSMKEIPVFVAGAGPSLDDCIDDIRRNRENVILVSCSTSLRPLLSAGLVPDFHAEVENMEDNVTIIQDAASVYDISDIVLLGTNTVRPGVVEPFKRRILYWRESVVPSRLFSDLDHFMNMAGPSVANLAVRACISMGFYEFYLFGVDMGSRDPSQHHSKSSIYYDRDDEYWNSGARMDPFVIPQPGNMRETVYTNPSFLLCKLYLDRLFQTFSNHFFFNCSDGVRFDRATAMLPKTLQVMPPEKPRSEFVNDCLSEIEFRHAGDQIPLDRMKRYREQLSDWFSAALECVHTADATSSRDLISGFYPLLGGSFSSANFSVESAVKGLCSGTVISILQFGHFFERRLAAEDRKDFMNIFGKALESALVEMQAKGLDLADDALSRIPRKVHSD